jgi:hypothetical protein
MKKLLLIFALAAFLGSTAAPAIAATTSNHQVVVDKDPKKDKDKKAEKKNAKSECTKSCKEQKSCDKKTSDPEKK